MSDPLGLDPEELRALGHWVVDAVVEHQLTLGDGPAIARADPAQLRAALGGPVPRKPGDPQAALQTLVDVALANMQHGDHPRYLARVPGPSSFAGILGDWLATGFNAIASSWGGGSGPSMVELVVLEWLRELLGLPAGAEGIVVSGGSAGNLTALAAARVERGAGIAYLSDQTHASIARGLRVLGFPAGEIRVLPADDGLRLSAATLAAAVTEDRRRGGRPRFVIATAGTTNTGAVDELAAIAELCAVEDLWLHIDGAYGAAAALCPQARPLLEGLEAADSVALDPHKWLFTPYDAGVVLVRHPGVLARAFAMAPAYLADVRGDAGGEVPAAAAAADPVAVDFGDRGLELTRRARALKLWMVLRVYGAPRIGEAIARGIALAEHAQSLLDDDSNWERLTAAQLGIVTFTGAGWGPLEPAARAAALAADGHAAVTSTTVRGQPALRLCTINPLTTEAEIADVLGRLAGDRGAARSSG